VSRVIEHRRGLDGKAAPGLPHQRLTHWKEHDTNTNALDRLLRDLQVEKAYTWRAFG
jgi:hypothetical protein